MYNARGVAPCCQSAPPPHLPCALQPRCISSHHVRDNVRSRSWVDYQAHLLDTVPLINFCLIVAYPRTCTLCRIVPPTLSARRVAAAASFCRLQNSVKNSGTRCTTASVDTFWQCTLSHHICDDGRLHPLERITWSAAPAPT